MNKIIVTLLVAICFSSVFAEYSPKITQAKRSEVFARTLNSEIWKFRKVMTKNDPHGIDVLAGMKTTGLISKDYREALLELLAAKIPFYEVLDSNVESFAKKRLSNAVLFPDFDAPIELKVDGQEQSKKQIFEIKNMLNVLRIKLLKGFFVIMLEAKIGCPLVYSIILGKLKNQIDLAKKVNFEDKSIDALAGFYDKAERRLKR